MDFSLSGQNSFEKTILEQIVVDAFERIGMSPEKLSSQQLQSAIRSANLLLSEWINQGLNLWSISHEMLTLKANQNIYDLPIATSSVGKVMLRTSTRQLGGTAFSSEGVAANAFDGDSSTDCSQSLINGYIGYDFGEGNTRTISLLGIQNSSQEDSSYTLNLEISKDTINWTVLESYEDTSYLKGELLWLPISRPLASRSIRIREVGGEILDIAELCFNNDIRDLPLAELSESEYAVIPNKTFEGRPSSFWLNRQINPKINLWPVPTEEFKTLFYSRIRMLEDVGSLINLVDVPQRFFEALTAGLAFKLSVKYDPKRASLLESLYEKSFHMAAMEDSQEAPLRVSTTQLSSWIE